MTISDKPEVSAVAVRLTSDRVYSELSAGREIGVPLAHYAFLRQASPEALANWTLEPHGFAVYWPDLSDGLEVRHLLVPQTL
jgi:hypothetical protein